MLVYLLVVTLTGMLSIPDFTQLHLQPTVVTHSFTLSYRDRISADLALQGIHTRWADALQIAVTAEVYEVCVPVPEMLPCAGGRIWIRPAPLPGDSP